MLIGVGGSGRKSLASLASFVAQYNLVSIIENNSLWREELKSNLINIATNNK